jgi:hypothetical protein
MGISPFQAYLLLLEHKHRPLPETVHLLGRQTISLTVDGALGLLARAGIKPTDVPIEIDRETDAAKNSALPLISDRSFLGMLGVKRVIAVDHSDYEGAEVIFDLNRPIPAARVATLDNVFDPASYLRNASRLLRPSGRLFEQDIISQHYHPYCLITPAWLFDFFVVNHYADCLLYVAEHPPLPFAHIYTYQPPQTGIASDFGPPRGRLPLGVVCIAEKGAHSTDNQAPIQDQYRSSQQAAEYSAALAIMGERRRRLPPFPVPDEGELALHPRASQSFPYLGVVRFAETPTPSRGGVRVLEATYGKNCLGQHMPAAAVAGLYPGNVTEVLACIFDGRAQTQWTVTTEILGDPAPQLGKDLEVLYTIASEPTRLWRAYLPAEACGQVLELPQRRV